MSEYPSSKMMILAGEPCFLCPGCDEYHRISVNQPNTWTGAIWQFNGDYEKPTFTPSIHIVGVCHCFVTNGMIQFLNDCSHELAGQTVPLPDIPAHEID